MLCCNWELVSVNRQTITWFFSNRTSIIYTCFNLTMFSFKTVPKFLVDKKLRCVNFTNRVENSKTKLNEYLCSLGIWFVGTDDCRYVVLIRSNHMVTWIEPNKKPNRCGTTTHCTEKFFFKRHPEQQKKNATIFIEKMWAIFKVTVSEFHWKHQWKKAIDENYPRRTKHERKIVFSLN